MNHEGRIAFEEKVKNTIAIPLLSGDCSIELEFDWKLSGNHWSKERFAEDSSRIYVRVQGLGISYNAKSDLSRKYLTLGKYTDRKMQAKVDDVAKLAKSAIERYNKAKLASEQKTAQVEEYMQELGILQYNYSNNSSKLAFEKGNKQYKCLVSSSKDGIEVSVVSIEFIDSPGLKNILK